MFNKDYIKEKLNTLRVEFMAHILVLIALGSGLSKMFLNGAMFNFKNYNLYSIGIIMFCILVLNLLSIYIKIIKTTKRLKDS